MHRGIIDHATFPSTSSTQTAISGDGENDSDIGEDE